MKQPIKNLKLAVRFEVVQDGKERYIQLYDKDNNKLKGEESYWEGNFNCYNNQLTSLVGSPKVVGGWFNCYNNQLTSLVGSPKVVGGSFYCLNNQLTSLKGSPKVVGGYFDCSNNQITSLKGSPKVIGGDFYCSNNQLTSLVGSPKVVGGGFDCSNNQITSLEHKPIENNPKARELIFNLLLKEGYVLADDILTKLISKRTYKGNILYKTETIGTQETIYVIQKDSYFSHGETIKEAYLDLLFKTNDRDPSKFKDLDINKKLPVDELVLIYRTITGACRAGVSQFISNQNLPKKLSIKEVIALTKNQYGYSEFKKFYLKGSN